MPSSLDAFTTLLLAFTPVAGWQVAGVVHGHAFAAEKAGSKYAVLHSNRAVDGIQMNIQLPDGDEVKLPRCTVAVTGANGRVGSMVCRELLRKHPNVEVRALIRDASNSYEGYGRLSYEVGAEDGKGTIRAAWMFDEEQTMEFDEEVQGGYGLDRLEIREADLRYEKDVATHLSDVDAIIYCATSFDNSRNRLPDRLDSAAKGLANFGMNLFELRFGDAFFGKGGDDESTRRREQVQDKIADVEGLELAIQIFEKAKQRRAKLNALTGNDPSSSSKEQLGIEFVLVSAAAALGCNKVGGQLEMTPFGNCKRLGEAALRASSLKHVIVRSAIIDGLSAPQGLPVLIDEDVAIAETVVGATGGESLGYKVNLDNGATDRRISPRDLAQFAVKQLCGEPEGTGNSKTLEIWTGSMARPLQFTPGK